MYILLYCMENTKYKLTEETISIHDDAWVSGDPHIYGDVHIYGDPRVSGDVSVFRYARVSGDVHIWS